MWPDPLPFNTVNYLDELQILEGENIFGNLFGDPILDMEDFILELPIPEDENIFGNIFGDYIFWMVGMKIGTRKLNWIAIHIGFTVFCLAMDSSHPKKSMMKYLDHFLQISQYNI